MAAAVGDERTAGDGDDGTLRASDDERSDVAEVEGGTGSDEGVVVAVGGGDGAAGVGGKDADVVVLLPKLALILEGSSLPVQLQLQQLFAPSSSEWNRLWSGSQQTRPGSRSAGC